MTGIVPVSAEVDPAHNPDALHRAKVLEISDGQWIDWPAFEPLRCVNLVSDFAASDKCADAILPESVIQKSNGQGMGRP